MSTEPTSSVPDLDPATKAAEEHDAQQGTDAGAPPTIEEAAIADANAEDVDVEAVEENYREMTDLGANVKGEGEI